MVKNTPKRITMMKNPLSSCRLPSTSSYSPSVLLINVNLRSAQLCLASGFGLFLAGETRQRALHRRKYIDRQRENNGGVFFCADLDQCLQIAQLDGGRLLLHHRRRLCQLIRRREFTFGVNDLG